MNPSSIRRDENDVQAVADLLTNVFIHPFREMPLAPISTGIILTENAAENMLESKINGMNKLGKFISDRIQPGKLVSFFDPIKRSNNMTFDTIKKTRTCKIKNKVMSIEHSKDLFSKIYLIALSRNIKLCDLFAFPLRAAPLVFAEIDGTLKKTPKSALLHKQEADIPPVDVPPVEDVSLNIAMIIDGIALVRQIRTSKMTSEEFAIKLLRHVLSIGQNSELIDLVFDVYRGSSIKDRKKEIKWKFDSATDNPNVTNQTVESSIVL